jgi:hypothetical protein
MGLILAVDSVRLARQRARRRRRRSCLSSLIEDSFDLNPGDVVYALFAIVYH